MTMRILLYTHSLTSDWNHGNAHFQRGLLRALQARGHETLALEPEDGWSRKNLIADQGKEEIGRFTTRFPDLNVTVYGRRFDHEAAVDNADVVLVHEWTDRDIVARLGRARRAGGSFTLCFHDTHHRAVSNEVAIADLALADYDIVLAFGEALRQRYVSRGWGTQVFTFHEAADTTLFRPMPDVAKLAELIWVGNWGDGERKRELLDYLVEPAKILALRGSVYGVRYPNAALQALAETALDYRFYLANADVPRVFAQHLMTVHVPRAPYVAALPGIPTIRVFEALACGIPLVCSPWNDVEGLFGADDFLVARDPADMVRHLRTLRSDEAMRSEMASRGRRAILARHSCGHRADELLAILAFRGTQRVRRTLAQTEAAQ
jgi:spore maturation protein CgeB